MFFKTDMVNGKSRQEKKAQKNLLSVSTKVAFICVIDLWCLLLCNFHFVSDHCVYQDCVLLKSSSFCSVCCVSLLILPVVAAKH